ncbi:MAG: hypothetical protein ACREMU_12055 [Gemmatimonadaceae bacterium]
MFEFSWDSGMSGMLNDSALNHREDILVDYYGESGEPGDSTAEAEARELLEIAIPVANQYGDSLIVIKRTRTDGPRWSPFVHGNIYFFVPPRRGYFFGKESGTWQDVTP